MAWRKLRTWAALWLCIGIWACDEEGPTEPTEPQDDGGQAAIDGSEASTTELDFGEFDEALEDFLMEKELEGATAAIVHKDEGVVHQAGYGAFSEDRVSLIASTSKVLSAGVLVRLADQGKLDLDEPISEYLSDWGEHKTDITVAQLLSNSSGLYSLSDGPLYEPYICQYLETGTLIDCAETIYTADDEEDRIAPDTEFKYGGGQWQLAGGIAEAVSGKSWDALIDETYRTPCGMEETAYTNHYSKANGEGDSLGYPVFFDGDVADLPESDNPNIEGGAYTTVNDYAQALQIHLRDGKCGDTQVLSKEGVERMQEDRVEAYGSTDRDTLTGYGLGWWIDRDHPGVFVDPGAYGAYAWLDLPRDYGVVILLEATSEIAGGLMPAVKPEIDAVFDQAEL